MRGRGFDFFFFTTCDLMSVIYSLLTKLSEEIKIKKVVLLLNFVIADLTNRNTVQVERSVQSERHNA